MPPDTISPPPVAPPHKTSNSTRNKHHNTHRSADHQERTRVDSGEEGERGRTRTSHAHGHARAAPAGPRPQGSRSRSRSDPARYDPGPGMGHRAEAVSPRVRSSSLDSHGRNHSSDAEDAQVRRDYDRLGHHQQPRRLSPTERLYASPEDASSALRAERAVNPAHRQVPTPHVSRSRRQTQQEPATPLDAGTDNEVAVYDSDTDDDRDGYDPNVRRMASQLSIRSTKSRVSFDDGHRPRDGLHGAPSKISTQVIEAGNMKPNHRALSSQMLKPALRGSTSRINLANGSGVDSDSSIGITPFPPTMRQPPHPPIGHGPGMGMEKALPHRPMSMLSPNVVAHSRPSADLQDDFEAVDRLNPQQPDFGTLHERQERMASAMAPPPSTLRRKLTRRGTRDGPNGRGRQYDPNLRINTQAQRPKLRGFLSSFSGLSISQSPTVLSPDRPSPYAHPDDQPTMPLHPAEDLALYLHRACVPEWVDWPVISGQGDSRRKGSTTKWLASLNLPGGSGGAGTMENMGWEWSRRLSEAINNQHQGPGRRLNGWEAMKGFEHGILEWCGENVPAAPIDIVNRWGKQIFALPARGFDTLEFHDEKAGQAADMGLLSWLTGSLLQTITSLLHTLRFSSSSFKFHLIPGPTPPEWAHSGSHRPDTHALWEGFGTLVLLNDQSATDRSLVLNVRPPGIVNSKVLREFSRTRREWWSLPGELCLGSTGQANLLQQQMYDDCVQNQVFYFVVTNLKYWVFGKFDPSYTSASVSEPIHFRSREPSVMQCLAGWVVRSVDERPRAIEASRQPLLTPSSPPMQAQAPAYTAPSRRPGRSHARAQSYPIPGPQGYTQPFGMYDPSAYPSQGQGQAHMWPGQYGSQGLGGHGHAQYAHNQHGQFGLPDRRYSAGSPMPMPMNDFGVPYGYGYGQTGQGMSGMGHVQHQSISNWAQGVERPFSPHQQGSDLGLGQGQGPGHAQGHGRGQASYDQYSGGVYGQPQRALWYGSSGWGMRA